ncbi:Uncharacterised protein [Mycobacteroides abscessus]|nr:Uncharacterised protein [Mycobacteroides abscessus]
MTRASVRPESATSSTTSTCAPGRSDVSMRGGSTRGSVRVWPMSV